MDQSTSKEYQIMKFQVLTFALTPIGEHKLSDGYVFAWTRGVYPTDHDGAGWHIPFGDEFRVSEDMMDQLIVFLDEKWTGKNYITFYELEDHYAIRLGTSVWERWSLMSACRYLYLCDFFDAEFWAHVLTPTKHPTEASSITRPYDRFDDVYFN